MGGSAGPQQATATVGALAPVTFSATAIVQVGTVALHEGNNQTGLQGFALNVRPAVIVRDLSSTPVAGVTVEFTVTGGGGSVQSGTVLSDANGIARVGNWIVANGSNALQANVTTPGYTGGPINFSATGVAPAYNIELRFLTAVTGAARAAFDSAEARWERLLYGDQTNFPLNRAAGTCVGISVPAVNETIDDLVIFVRLDSIDGPLNQLGGAGWCVARGSDTIPVLGAMRFDTADVATFVANGLFDEIVMHEMGHVIGFGTVWTFKGRLIDPSLSGGTDPHFNGPQAIAAFDRSGGAGYSAGSKVPVADVGGPGTADAHWRESVFDTELMTGLLDGGVPNPLSVISVAQFLDLGYTLANFAAADAYVVANPLAFGAAAAPSTTKISLHGDVLSGTLELIDASGRVLKRMETPW
jgi:hypothetical protein